MLKLLLNQTFANAGKVITKSFTNTAPVSKLIVDTSKFPELRESDLEEHFIHGGGPGGQCVNKTSNACYLLHKPTGLSVKCHQTRSLHRNRKIARLLLQQQLDIYINAEDSVFCQKKNIEEKKHCKYLQKSHKKQLMKKHWKQREGID